jgi:hypothetical protein
MRRYALIGLLLIAALAAGVMSFGFGGATEAGLVPLDQLPGGFLNTARKELPKVKFDKAWRLRNGNYEIRGKDTNGKAREVELNAKGIVVEVD